jgi:hypothetical protein
MNFKLVAIALALTVAALTGPAAAAAKHHGKRQGARTVCVDRPTQFSWDFLWSTGNPPRPNGCAPAVYQYGRFIGQDPDPNVRFQLLRDPGEGDLSLLR